MTWHHGAPIPDDEEISRYCKPSHYDHLRDEPHILAFTRRKTEDDVSVNRLQYYLRRTANTREEAINFIRCEVKAHYQLKTSGRFLVVNVGAIKNAGARKGHSLQVLYTPEHGKPSHSSIFGVPSEHEEEITAAVAMLRAIRCLITPQDVYQGCA